MDAGRVRALALGLGATAERPAPRHGHPQFVTNGKCFAELPGGEPPVLRLWADGTWASTPLAELDGDALEAALLAAWRRRAKRSDVAALDYAQGAEELADLFATLRTWPELTERSTGDFLLGGRPFLHFHHGETRHADVRKGIWWGAPVPFPLGRPPQDVVEAFLAKARHRLELTLEADAERKRRGRGQRA